MPESQPLEIAVVFPADTRGGAEIWQERLADRTDRLRLRVVALSEGATADVWRERGARVDVAPVGTAPADLLRGALTVATRLRRDRPEVLLAHGVKAGLVALGAGWLSSTRVVWVRHDQSFPRLAAVLNRLADGSIVSSDAVALPGHDPMVVSPVTAAQPLPADEARAALELPRDDAARRLVMATRLVPYKGVDDAIVALVDARAEEWELHVFGIADAAYPRERERLSKLAADLGVADRFCLHESRDDIGALMAAFDAAAVLTKHLPGEHVGSEGFSMVAMEAAAAGVPVIATGTVAERFAGSTIGVDEAAPGQVAIALRELPKLEFDYSASTFGPQGDLAHYLANAAHRPGAGTVGQSPISVVTTTLNDLTGLHELSAALLPQLRPDDEWVVVDAGSTDGGVEFLQGLNDPRIVVKVVAGAGISRGRNEGISIATHDLIACTDAGCEPDPGWLDALRAAADARPDAVLFTGIYRVTAVNDIERAMVAVGYPSPTELAHPSPLSRLYGRFLGRAYDATMPTGRSVAFTRAAWSSAGGFPEHLQTGEDVTFGRAIASDHPSVLVADACVSWHQRASLRESLRMYYRYGQGSGLSGNPRLLARDFARIGAYSVAAVGLSRGRTTTRAVAAAGLTAYLSLPLVRAAHLPRPGRAMALVPVIAALRDGAKAAGAVSGCLRRW